MTSQEAIYELGVCDNGLLLGIDRKEMDASLHTLRCMADGLGARVKIVREVQVDLASVSTTTLSPTYGSSAACVASTETRLESWKVNAILNKEAKDRECRKASTTSVHEADQLEVVYNSVPPAPSYTPDGKELTSRGKPKALTRKLRRSIRRENGFPPSTSTAQSDAAVDIAAHQDVVSGTAAVEITDFDDPGQDAPSTATDTAEQERLRIRRHLRKQWKKEKQLEKRTHLQSSTPTSFASTGPAYLYPHKGKHTNCNSPAWVSTPPNAHSGGSIAVSPEDRFMDALVSIFDGVTLGPLTAEEEALYRTYGANGPTGKAKKKKRKWRHRYNHLKKVAEMAVTLTDEVVEDVDQSASSLPSDTSWYDSPRVGSGELAMAAGPSGASRNGDCQTIPFSVPMPPSTNGSSRTLDSGKSVAVHRFAIECLVYIPEEEEEAEDKNELSSSARGEADDVGLLEEEEEEEEDPLFGGSMSANKPRVRPRERLRSASSDTGGSRRPSGGSGKNSFMRQHYIDFENPDLLLP